MKTIELILAERGKQIAKGYTSEHDDEHKNGEIAMAAAAYVCPEYKFLWPWDKSNYTHSTDSIDVIR